MPDQIENLLPAASIGLDRRLVFRGTGRMRQDLPPEETSQILRLMSRDKTVGDDDIFPAIIVDVHEV